MGDAPLVNLNLTEPITKLIEVVSSAIGTLYEPRRIHLKSQSDAKAALAEAKAEGEVAIVKAKAAAEVASLIAKGEEDAKGIHDRASERIRRKEERRQKNIESITRNALAQLPGTVEEKKPDEDWVQQFFNFCEDIGDDQMQILWGKLLAGEVANPGSFSLRTLSTVKLLSRQDADLFTSFCMRVWVNDREALFPVAGKLSINDVTPEFDLQKFAHLESLGLIHYTAMPGYNVSFPYSSQSGKTATLMIYGDKKVLLSWDDPKFKLPIGNCLLTSTGKDLFRICGTTFDLDYFNRVLAAWGQWKINFSLVQ